MSKDLGPQRLERELATLRPARARVHRK